MSNCGWLGQTNGYHTKNQHHTLVAGQSRQHNLANWLLIKTTNTKYGGRPVIRIQTLLAEKNQQHKLARLTRITLTRQTGMDLQQHKIWLKTRHNKTNWVADLKQQHKVWWLTWKNNTNLYGWKEPTTQTGVVDQQQWQPGIADQK